MFPRPDERTSMGTDEQTAVPRSVGTDVPTDVRRDTRSPVRTDVRSVRTDSLAGVPAVLPLVAVATAATAALYRGSTGVLWCSALVAAVVAAAGAVVTRHGPARWSWAPMAAHLVGLVAVLAVVAPGVDGTPALAGVATGPRRLVTLPAPTDARGPELGVAVLAVWLAAALAVRLAAGRSPVRLVASLPPLVLAAVAVVLGPGPVAAAGAVGVGLTDVGPSTLAESGRAATELAWAVALVGAGVWFVAVRIGRRAIVPAGAVVAVAAVVATVVVPRSPQPVDLHRVDPPARASGALDDPLRIYEQVRLDDRAWFTADVAPTGDAPDELWWRLAVLDRLGGGSWETSPGSFRAVTGPLADPGSAAGPPVQATVGLAPDPAAAATPATGTTRLRLVPVPVGTIGATAEADATGTLAVDPASGTVVVTATPTGRASVVLDVRATSPTSASDADAWAPGTGTAEGVASALAPVVDVVPATGTGLARLRALERWFRRDDLFASAPAGEGLTGSGLAPVRRLLCGSAPLPSELPPSTTLGGGTGDADDARGAPTGSPQREGGPGAAPVEGVVPCVRPGADGEVRVATPDTFASAFALLAASAGFRVRLVVGARTAGSGAVAGDRTTMAVWPEVARADGSWVAFWPTPTRVEDPSARPVAPATTATTALPPLVTPDAQTAAAGVDAGAAGDSVGTERSPFVLVVLGAGALGTFLVMMTAAAVLVRRAGRARSVRRGRAEVDPRRRAVGAWRHLERELASLGLVVRPDATRSMVADRAGPVVGRAGARRLSALARAVDAAQFDPAFAVGRSAAPPTRPRRPSPSSATAATSLRSSPDASPSAADDPWVVVTSVLAEARDRLDRSARLRWALGLPPHPHPDAPHPYPPHPDTPHPHASPPHPHPDTQGDDESVAAQRG